MATIRFYLRTQKSKMASVYLRFIDNGGVNIITRTPFKMYPQYWNDKKQRFNDKILLTEVFTQKDKLDIEEKFHQLRDYILREYLKLQSPPNVTWLNSTINSFFSKDAPNHETLIQYIRRFVEEAESGKRLATSRNTKKKYSYGSLRVLRGFMLSFELYHTDPRANELFNLKYTKEDLEKPEPKPEVIKYYNECKKQAEEELLSGTLKQKNFNDITMDFYNDFIQFFYDRNCGANYIGKHIKSLKTILRQAREEGLHQNMEVERKSFKAISEEVDNIYLTEDEVKRIFELELSEKHLQHVRDVFLVGVYTAQRYSDYSKINKDNVREKDGRRTIELFQQKTGEKCIIPIRPELESILGKYGYNLPKTFEQKINQNIKKIGRMAGITTPVRIEKNRGGFVISATNDKCDLIKTHTARRSGCTNMYLAGIPVIDIMKISGHKTEREFLKYVKVSKEETAINLAAHPYFRGNTLSIAK